MLKIIKKYYSDECEVGDVIVKDYKSYLVMRKTNKIRFMESSSKKIWKSHELLELVKVNNPALKSELIEACNHMVKYGEHHFVVKIASKHTNLINTKEALDLVRGESA